MNAVRRCMCCCWLSDCRRCCCMIWQTTGARAAPPRSSSPRRLQQQCCAPYLIRLSLEHIPLAVLPTCGLTLPVTLKQQALCAPTGLGSGKLLQGYIPSSHDMQHVEHLSGVFSTLWPKFAAANPHIQVCLAFYNSIEGMNRWGDWSPFDWPGAAPSPFGNHAHMELWSGTLGFHSWSNDNYNSVVIAG
jgi:hypothetical protein